MTIVDVSGMERHSTFAPDKTGGHWHKDDPVNSSVNNVLNAFSQLKIKSYKDSNRSLWVQCDNIDQMKNGAWVSRLNTPVLYTLQDRLMTPEWKPTIGALMTAIRNQAAHLVLPFDEWISDERKHEKEGMG